MPELSAAVILVVPLALVIAVALFLLRQGMTGSELTEASRQRFVGCGFLLLLIGLMACAAIFAIGVKWLLKFVPLS